VNASSTAADHAAASSDAARLLVKLARGLHTYGTPAHRIESALEVATERFGLSSQFFSLPTVILAAFGPPELRSTGLIRVQPGSVDLGKLASLDEVLRGLVAGRLGVAEAEARIDAIEARAPRWGALLTIAAFALASACAARFFGGGVREIAAAALLGAGASALGFLQRVRPGFQRIFEAAAAFCVAFAAYGVARGFGGISDYVVTVASLVVLLPGLSFTMAISELAAQSLVSGTVRLVSAAVVLVELTFGVALGRAAGIACFGAVDAVGAEAAGRAADAASLTLAATPGAPLPEWTIVLALALAPCAFTVLFRAALRDLVPILVAGAIGFAGDRLGSAAVGPSLGVFFGAFAVALGSNVWARVINRPVAVTLFPGLLLLVPGSVGFRGAMLMLERDVVSGVETAFRMVFVAAAIVAGMLFAHVMVPARRAL
jgi:uncharacterized membrane protein YjjP (DUF1212 family)